MSNKKSIDNKWLASIYYYELSFTDRIMFESQSECLKYIYDLLTKNKINKDETYLKIYCGHHNNDEKLEDSTSFVFIYDRREDYNNPKIYLTIEFGAYSENESDNFFFPIELEN